MSYNLFNLAGSELWNSKSIEEKEAMINAMAMKLPENERDGFYNHANTFIEGAARDAGVGRVVNEGKILESLRSVLPSDFDSLGDQEKVDAIESARPMLKNKIAQIDPITKNDTAFFADTQLSSMMRAIKGKDIGAIEDKKNRFLGGIVSSVIAPISENYAQELNADILPTNPDMDKSAISKLSTGAGDFAGQIAQYFAIAAMIPETGGGSLALLGLKTASTGSRIAMGVGFATNVSRKFQQNYNTAVGEMGLSEDDAIKAGIAGMPGALIDSFGDALLMKGIKLGSVSKSFKAMTAAEKATEIVAKGASVIKQPKFMQSLISDAAKGGLTEGLSEMLGDAATSWGGFMTSGHEGFKPKAEALWESFWIGGVLGGSFAGFGTRSNVRNQSDLMKIGKIEETQIASMSKENQDALASMMDSENYTGALELINKSKKQVQQAVAQVQPSNPQAVAAPTPRPATTQPQQVTTTQPATGVVAATNKDADLANLDTTNAVAEDDLTDVEKESLINKVIGGVLTPEMLAVENPEISNAAKLIANSLPSARAFVRTKISKEQGQGMSLADLKGEIDQRLELINNPKVEAQVTKTAEPDKVETAPIAKATPEKKKAARKLIESLPEIAPQVTEQPEATKTADEAQNAEIKQPEQAVVAPAKKGRGRPKKDKELINKLGEDNAKAAIEDIKEVAAPVEIPQAAAQEDSQSEPENIDELKSSVFTKMENQSVLLSYKAKLLGFKSPKLGNGIARLFANLKLAKDKEAVNKINDSFDELLASSNAATTDEEIKSMLSMLGNGSPDIAEIKSAAGIIDEVESIQSDIEDAGVEANDAIEEAAAIVESIEEKVAAEKDAIIPRIEKAKSVIKIQALAQQFQKEGLLTRKEAADIAVRAKKDGYKDAASMMQRLINFEAVKEKPKKKKSTAKTDAGKLYDDVVDAENNLLGASKLNSLVKKAKAAGLINEAQEKEIKIQQKNDLADGYSELRLALEQADLNDELNSELEQKPEKKKVEVFSEPAKPQKEKKAKSAIIESQKDAAMSAVQQGAGYMRDRLDKIETLINYKEQLLRENFDTVEDEKLQKELDNIFDKIEKAEAQKDIKKAITLLESANADIDLLSTKERVVSKKEIEQMRQAAEKEFNADDQALLNEALTNGSNGMLFQNDPEGKDVLVAARSVVEALEKLGIENTATEKDQEIALEMRAGIQLGIYSAEASQRFNAEIPSRAILSNSIMKLKNLSHEAKRGIIMNFDVMAINSLKYGRSLQAFYATVPNIVVVDNSVSGTGALQVDKEQPESVEDFTAASIAYDQAKPINANFKKYRVEFSPIPNTIILGAGTYNASTVLHEQDHNMIVTGVAQEIIEAESPELWDEVLKEVGAKRGEFWSIAAHEKWTNAREAWIRDGGLSPDNIFTKVFNILKGIYRRLYSDSVLSLHRNPKLEKAFVKIYSIENSKESGILAKKQDQFIDDLSKIKDQNKKFDYLVENNVIEKIENESAVEYGDRPIVIAKIGNARIPFYQSTGRGGKANTPAGKWYAYFGHGPKDGWFNKGDERQINSYYGSPLLRKIANILNDGVGKVDPAKLSNIRNVDVINNMLGLPQKPSNLSDGDWSSNSNPAYLLKFAAEESRRIAETTFELTKEELINKVSRDIGEDAGKLVGEIPADRLQFAQNLISLVRAKHLSLPVDERIDAIKSDITKEATTLNESGKREFTREEIAKIAFVATSNKSLGSKKLEVTPAKKEEAIARYSIIPLPDKAKSEKARQSKSTTTDDVIYLGYSPDVDSVDAVQENGVTVSSGAEVASEQNGVIEIQRPVEAISIEAENISQDDKTTYMEYVNAKSWSADIAKMFAKDFADWMTGLKKFTGKIANVFLSFAKSIKPQFIAALSFVSTATFTGDVNLQSAKLDGSKQIDGVTIKNYSLSSTPKVKDGTYIQSLIEISGGSVTPYENDKSAESNSVSNDESNSDAGLVYKYVMESQDNDVSPFIIVSKREGVLRMYDKDGKLLHKTNVLLGKDYGDEIKDRKQTLDEILAGSKEKITTSGRFETKTTKSGEYGRVVATDDLENYRIAIHRVCLKFAHEKRAQRLAGVGSNRISFGCINVPATSSDYVNNTFENGGVVYVTPDFQETSEFINELKMEKSENPDLRQDGGILYQNPQDAINSTEYSEEQISELVGAADALLWHQQRIGSVMRMDKNGNMIEHKSFASAINAARRVLIDSVNKQGGKSKAITKAQVNKNARWLINKFQEVMQYASPEEKARTFKDARERAYNTQSIGVSEDSLNPNNNLKATKENKANFPERIEIQQKTKFLVNVFKNDKTTNRLVNSFVSHVSPLYRTAADKMALIMSRGAANVLGAFNSENENLLVRFADNIAIFNGRPENITPEFIDEFNATIDEVDSAIVEYKIRQFLAYNSVMLIPDSESTQEAKDLSQAILTRKDGESGIDYLTRLEKGLKDMIGLGVKEESEAGSDSVSGDTAKELAAQKRLDAIRERRVNYAQVMIRSLGEKFPTFEDFISDRETQMNGAISDKFRKVYEAAYNWVLSTDVESATDDDLREIASVGLTLVTRGHHSSILKPYIDIKRQELANSWIEVVRKIGDRATSLTRNAIRSSGRNTVFARALNTFDKKIQANVENFSVWADRFSKYPMVRDWMHNQFFKEFTASAFNDAENASKNQRDEVQAMIKAYNDSGIDTTREANPYLWVNSIISQYNVGTDPNKHFAKMVQKARNSIARAKKKGGRYEVEADRNLEALNYTLRGIDIESKDAFDQYSKVAFDRIGLGNPELSTARTNLLRQMQDMFSTGIADQIFIREVIHKEPFTTVHNYIPFRTEKTDGTQDEFELTEIDFDVHYPQNSKNINKMSNEDRSLELPENRMIGMDLFNMVERKLIKNNIDAQSIVSLAVMSEMLKTKNTRKDGVDIFIPKEQVMRDVFGSDEHSSSQLALIKEKLTHQMIQIYGVTEPPNSMVSVIRKLNGGIQSMMLSGIGQIVQQSASAMVDYSLRESGNSTRLLKAISYYSKNYKQVREWMAKYNKDLYERGNTQGIIENEKHINNAGQQVKPYLDKLGDAADTFRKVLTLSLRYGDKIGAELIFLAEHRKAIESAGLLPNDADYDIDDYHHSEFTARAMSNLARFVGSSGAAGRSYWMSDHTQAMSLLRAVTGSFQSSAHNMSSQMLSAARNYVDLKKDGSPESDAEAKKELRVIASIAAQQLTFTATRHVFTGMLVLATAAAIRSAFDDEDDKITELQLALEKARSASYSTPVEKARAINEIERMIADAKSIRKATISMSQQTSGDALFKSVVRDQVSNLHIAGTVGDSFVPKMFMMVANAFHEQNAKGANELMIENLKKQKSQAIAIGDRVKAAKLAQQIVDLQAIEYIPYFYEKKDKSGFGGIIGGVVDPIYTSTKEATEDLSRSDKDFMTSRAFIPDMLMYMSSIGLGQADVNRVAKQLQRIDDDLAKNREEAKARLDKKTKELINKP